MECSRPKQQGDVPTAQAGHAGATVVENWFIAGAGGNKSGMFLQSFSFYVFTWIIFPKENEEFLNDLGLALYQDFYVILARCQLVNHLLLFVMHFQAVINFCYHKGHQGS